MPFPCGRGPDKEVDIASDLSPYQSPPLMQLLNASGPLGNAKIREKLQLKDRAHLREHYIAPALAFGAVEMTSPDRPSSRLKKCRLTEHGNALIKKGEQGQL